MRAQGQTCLISVDTAIVPGQFSDYKHLFSSSLYTPFPKFLLESFNGE